MDYFSNDIRNIQQVEERAFMPATSTGDEAAKYSFIQWLNIDDDILHKLETILRGYKMYPVYAQNGVFIGYRVDFETRERPKCNEEGVKDIINFLAMHLNKNVRMSNVNRDEVYRDVREVALDVNCYVYENWRRWELDLDFYDALIDILVYNIWYSFNRAKDEGERKQAGRQFTETRVQQQVESRSDKKEGLFSKFG